MMDATQREKLLKQLASTDGEVAKKALTKQVGKIASALKNDTRYDLIEEQLGFLDAIAFRVSKKALEVLLRFLDSLDTRELTYQPDSYISQGRLEKFQNTNTLRVKVLNVLGKIRYFQLDQILDLFIKLSGDENEEVRKTIEQNLNHISEYNLQVFYAQEGGGGGLGPGPQQKILEMLESFDDFELKEFSSPIILLCENLLSPTIAGTSWDYKTVTWSHGAIPASKEIKDVRGRSLNLLESLYGLSTSTPTKISILGAMQAATRTPHNVDYGDDVLEMVSGSTVRILRFFKEIVADEDLSIVQKIEHDSYWQFFRAIKEPVKTVALEIREALDSNNEYQIFKVLIGFEGIFHDWERPEDDTPSYRDIDKYRTEKANEFSAGITNANFPEWRERILKYSQIKSNDLATFPIFSQFLKKFAHSNPDLALTLIREDDQALEGFLVSLLLGIWLSESKEAAHELALSWLAEGKYLLHLARLVQFIDDFDESLTVAILDKAKAAEDPETLTQIAVSVAEHYREDRKQLIQKMFLDVIQELTKYKSTNWVNHLWFREERHDLMSDLDDKGINVILENLHWLPAVEYHAEDILTPIANQAPQRVIQYFYDRSMEEKVGEFEYDAIPFELHNLQIPLSQIPAEAIDLIRGWYDGDYSMFIYGGANLIKNIFPDFPKPFEDKLIELVLTGEEENLTFVMAILRNYRGDVSIFNVAKEIIKTLQEENRLLNEVVIILSSTGVVTGEFGFVEAYEQKKGEVADWLNDKSVKIRKFARYYISYLEKRIDSERKNAEEDIALRKFQYGSKED